MNMTLGPQPEFRGAAAAVTFLLGLLLLAGSGALSAQYEGTEYYYDCHDQEYY